jgi:hypothetical protein
MLRIYLYGYGAGDGHKLFVNVQPVVPFSLNEDLNLISRTIIPLVFDQHRITNPLSGQQTGFGDVVQSAWLSNNVSLDLGGLGDLVWGIHQSARIELSVCPKRPDGGNSIKTYRNLQDIGVKL